MAQIVKSAAFLSALLIGVFLAEANAATNVSAANTGANLEGKAHGTTNTAVDRQKKVSQDAAQKTLINDAVLAISETQRASESIAKGDSANALAALERATGKLDLLIARNPSTSLLPVRVETIVIENAPADLSSIKKMSDRAQRALATKDYPLARVLLGGLQEEIRVRTYNLPLATYPQAIKQAARLIDKKKTSEASKILTAVLNTLVLVDHVFPETTIKAQAAVQVADSLRTMNKDESLRLVDSAKQELVRAEALGYAGNSDPEFSALRASVESVDRQLRANGGLVSFEDLKKKLANFFKHQSQTGRSGSIL